MFAGGFPVSFLLLTARIVLVIVDCAQHSNAQSELRGDTHQPSLSKPRTRLLLKREEKAELSASVIDEA